jgi:hypothetical protein
MRAAKSIVKNAKIKIDNFGKNKEVDSKINVKKPESLTTFSSIFL